MKKILFVFFLSSLFNICFGQDLIKIKKNSHIQAQKMVQAFLKQDYDTFIKYLPEKLKESLPNDINFSKGVPGIRNIVVKKPEKCVVIGTEIQCLLEQQMTMSMKGSLVLIISSIIGVSYNSGDNWYFLSLRDKSALSMKFLKVIIPNLSEEILNNASPRTFTMLGYDCEELSKKVSKEIDETLGEESCTASH